MSATIIRKLNIGVAVPASEITLGSVINDRFVLEEELGSGGMGTVYKARDKRKEEAGAPQAYVAIKIINEQFKQHPEAFIALQHEAAKAQELSHPHIVRIFDFDRHGDIAYITMEYLEGLTLAELLKNIAHHTLTYEQKLKMVSQIAEALHFAHEQGYTHADLKPSNIFVTKEHNIKIIDFGLANALKEGEEIQLDTETNFSPEQLKAYSPAYSSKEVQLGEKPIPSDDIYSFACIVYELFTDVHPYQRQSAVEVSLKNISPQKLRYMPKAQRNWLFKALSPERKNRQRSLKDFVSLFNRTIFKFNVWYFLGAVILIASMVLLANQLDPLF